MLRCFINSSPGSEFRVGAAVCPSKIHIKPLSEIAGRLPARTVPATEGAAFQIHRRGRQAPGEEFLHSAAFSAPVGLFLIQCNFLLAGGIKFLRHFVALLGIVNDVKAVDAEHIIVLILCTELLNERLECIDLAKVTRPWPRNYP